MNKFKKHAAMFIASHLPSDQIQGLKELFDSMDADGSGTITLDELRQSLEARGSHLPADELERLMAIADVNGDGELDYAEFLATTLHSSRLEEEANMLLAFRHFDRDGDGRISPEELRYALAAAGDPVSAREVADIIASVDQDGNGEIDYGEFTKMMMDHAQATTTGLRRPDGRSVIGAALGVTCSGHVRSSDIAPLREGGPLLPAASGGSSSSLSAGGVPLAALQPQLP